MTNRKADIITAICLVVIFLCVAMGWIGDSAAGGVNTAGGLCPDGIQEGDEGGGWTSSTYWKRLPQSDGPLNEQVSDKWDHVQMNVFLCNDGSVMGRADFRRGSKGR